MAVALMAAGALMTRFLPVREWGVQTLAAVEPLSLIHIKNPSYEELKEWHEKSGLPLKKFFNTSGLLYKEMKLKDRLPEMSGDEQLKLLATNGMLVKRPLIVDGSTVITGFKEKEWSEQDVYKRQVK